MNSVCKDQYTVLCAARRSGWTWQSPFWILAFASTVALNCQNTSQNVCHGCEKRKKSNTIRIFLWRTKISEAVCKRDWHNVRSYLFFNVRKIRTQCAMALMHKNGIWPEWKCKFTLIRWHFQKFDTAQLSVSACQERNSNSIYMFLNSHSDFCIKHQVLVLCNSSGSGNVTKSTNLIGWPHFSQIKMFITSNICLGVTRGQLHKFSHHVKTVS